MLGSVVIIVVFFLCIFDIGRGKKKKQGIEEKNSFFFLNIFSLARKFVEKNKRFSLSIPIIY